MKYTLSKKENEFNKLKDIVVKTQFFINWRRLIIKLPA